MALTNPCFKDQNWSHLREPVERERGKSKEEKKRKRKKMEKPRYGCLDFGLELYGFVWIFLSRYMFVGCGL